MHIGILTGGGDCPGLNAVIRALTLALHSSGPVQVSGILRGFQGLAMGQARPLLPGDVEGILDQGGTILGTHNRYDPFRVSGGAERSLKQAQEWGMDAVVVIGGDGSMDIAHRFELRGLAVVGVPKTIDNDLPHTERTFGFDSAVAIVAQALDRLRTTAESHGRVMIAETMGRYAGWIALHGGLAGGADIILLPEWPFDLEAVAQRCRQREQAGQSTLICMAEGARLQGGELTLRATLADSPDPLRLGGAGRALEQALQPLLDNEVRSVQLGHTQRGGTPTAFDRVLATQFGFEASRLLQRRQYGQMVALQGERCVSVPLAQVAGSNRTVPQQHPLLLAAQGLGVLLG